MLSLPITQARFINSKDIGYGKKQICYMLLSEILNVTEYKSGTSYNMASVIGKTNTSIESTLQQEIRQITTQNYIVCTRFEVPMVMTVKVTFGMTPCSSVCMYVSAKYSTCLPESISLDSVFKSVTIQ
jgi:hypothetical protein